MLLIICFAVAVFVVDVVAVGVIVVVTGAVALCYCRLFVVCFVAVCPLSELLLMFVVAVAVVVDFDVC